MAHSGVITSGMSEISRSHRLRHLRAWRFQALLLIAAVAFGFLAFLAHTILYFPVDLTLTLAIQSARSPWLDMFLTAVSWVGYPPQSNFIFGTLIVVLLLIGRRLEAIGLFIAAAGSFGLWFVLAPLVNRPRPSPDLVEVAHQIPFGSFPSGHALNLTAIFGFLFYLVYTNVQSTWPRRLLLVLLALPVLTVGIARVQAGAHWPSDVLGGYMLGSLWLALTIHLYRWATQRFSKHQGSRGHES